MSNYKNLYIFVEGDYDKLLIERIIESKLKEKGYYVYVYKYAQSKKENVENFIKSINSMKDSDYIFLADINSEPCISSKKQKLIEKYGNLESNKIIVVIKEIESWYLAGLDKSAFKKLKIKFKNKNYYSNTECITKEEFETLNPNNPKNIEFYSIILENFSIKIACQKNKSFNYFIKRYNLH